MYLTSDPDNNPFLILIVLLIFLCQNYTMNKQAMLGWYEGFLHRLANQLVLLLVALQLRKLTQELHCMIGSWVVLSERNMSPLPIAAIVGTKLLMQCLWNIVDSGHNATLRGCHTCFYACLPQQYFDLFKIDSDLWNKR